MFNYINKLIYLTSNPFLLYIKLKGRISKLIYKFFANNFFTINVIKMCIEKIYFTKSYTIDKDYSILNYNEPINLIKISLLCPTRDRSDNIIRLLDSIRITSYDLSQIQIVFYIDYDDRKLMEFFNVEDLNLFGINIKVIVGNRILLSDMWNICYLNSSGPILMHCSDDIIFKTNNWDKIVIDSFELIPDKIAFVHGSDGVNDFPTHGFLHKNWCDTLGYFLPPYFSSDFNDTWLNDVSLKLGRKIFIPILTDHMHPGLNKSAYDKNYLQNLNRGVKDNVSVLYSITKTQRELDFLKLKIKIIESLLNK